jgi:hypothetical protein
MSDAIEEATNAKLPFGMGEVDLTNPVMVVALAIALTAGATMWNMADSIGAGFASRINAWLAGLTNTDVGGSSSGPGTNGGGL